MSFALLACVVSAAFAVVVGARFRASRRPAFGSWALGLVIFAAAAAFQAYGEARGFTPAVFRGFYLFGGVLGVAYLALGTVFLLAPRRVAWAAAVVLGLVTLACGIDALLIPVDAGQLSTPAGVLGGAISHGTLLFVAVVVVNIVGSLVLIGGSAWSAWRLLRDRAGLDRLVCNVLLTVGAFIVAAGFSAAKLATHSVLGGGLDVLGGYEALGITIMFLGFLSLGRIRLGARQPAASRTAA